MKQGIRFSGAWLGLLAWGLAVIPSSSLAVTLLTEGFGDFPAANGWNVTDTNAAGVVAFWGGVNSAFGGEGTYSGSWKGYCAAVGHGGTDANPTYPVSMGSKMQKQFNLHGYSTATLTFWYKLPSIGAGDSLEVYWGNTLLWARIPGQSQPAWTQVTLSLNPFAGLENNQLLKFIFSSDGATNGEGAYLDQIILNAFRPAADAYEADNTSGTAKKIVCNQRQTRTIHVPGDVDWVKFTVGNSGARDFVVETSEAVDGAWDAQWDTKVWLYTAALVQVAVDDDGGVNRFSRIEVDTLPPGTYFIKIEEFGNNGVIPGYHLFVSWTPTFAPDAYESDNFSSNAKTIANGTTQNRSIHLPGNEDWAKFVVGAAGMWDVTLETSGSAGDTEMWLVRGSGEVAGYDDDSGAGNFSRLFAPVLTPGTYFIRIREYLNDGTIPAYTLRLNGTATIAPDAYEADDSGGTAKTIANGETQNRSIHAAGNTDFAKFVVPAAGAVNVVVETDGTIGDTQVWVIKGSNGVQMGFDDDSGAGAFSRVEMANLTAGTYFIKVQENGNNGAIPAYTLRAAWAAP